MNPHLNEYVAQMIRDVDAGVVGRELLRDQRARRRAQVKQRKADAKARLT